MVSKDIEENRVSIIIPVRNVEDYVEEAVKSLFSQTYKNIEIIIINDNSVDRTRSLLDGLAKLDSRLKVYDAIGKGKVAAFNQGWSICSGEYIFLFAGDDVLPNNSIENRCLLFGDGVDVATGKIKSFSNNKKYDGIVYPKKNAPNLSGGAAGFTREFANKIFPIPELLPNEDIWTSLHIRAFAKKINWTNDIILNYRIHENNSMGFGVAFDKKSEIIGSRNKAYKLFLEKYKNVLDLENLNYLDGKIKAEGLRKEGRIWSLLFLGGVSLKDRLANISFSSELTYKVRVVLEKYLSGR